MGQAKKNTVTIPQNGNACMISVQLLPSRSPIQSQDNHPIRQYSSTIRSHIQTLPLTINTQSIVPPSNLSQDKTVVHSGTPKSLLSLLTDSIVHRRESVSIPPSMRVTKDDVLQTLGTIYENDYRATIVGLDGCSIRGIGDYVTNVGITYASSTNNWQQEIVDCSQMVESLSHDARDTGGLNDAIIVRYVHDWLVRECEYATELKDVNVIGDSRGRTAWDAIVNHRCVCAGYSLALKAALLRCGIPCCLVTSRDMNHMWNMVMVDGAWYHVDVTFDDPVSPYGHMHIRQTIMRDNLLLSDETVRRTGHSGWVRDAGAFVTRKSTPVTPTRDYHADADDYDYWHGETKL